MAALPLSGEAVQEIPESDIGDLSSLSASELVDMLEAEQAMVGRIRAAPARRAPRRVVANLDQAAATHTGLGPQIRRG